MTNATAAASGAARTRPFTSQEYLESLRDGREIWIYGERVKDVTTHPAFRNTVRMLGRLYDALHDQRKSVLCAETDTGSGGYTHKFYKAPRNSRVPKKTAPHINNKPNPPARAFQSVLSPSLSATPVSRRPRSGR